LIKPELIEVLSERAIEEKNYPLLWRIYSAVKIYKTINREDIERRAAHLKEKITKVFFEKMDEASGLNMANFLSKV